MLENFGQVPGTPTYTGSVKLNDPIITNIVFNTDKFKIQNYNSYLSFEKNYHADNTKEITWNHIEPISDQEAISKLGSLFNLHSLAVEDILNVNSRSKIDKYNTYTLIKTTYPIYENKELKFYQISFILQDNLLISFADKTPDRFKIIIDRLKQDDSIIRNNNSQYLLFTLLDLIIDNYFLLLKKLDRKIEKLEKEIIYAPTNESIKHIHTLKRLLIRLKGEILSLNEIIKSLLKSNLIEEDYIIYYNNIYDHTTNIIDVVDGYKDSVSSYLDIYLSTLGNRMNEIMKTLSIISTIFIPLSFLTGYFGMNFKDEYSEILKYNNAFTWANLSMLIIPVLLLVYFKYRKWF